MATHHPHEHELKHSDGSWKFTNALANQTSPYLLQHAHNPVDWLPWGEEAFNLAQSQGKPVFLSIGYSTCYWCHVMERQVFENPRIAQQMNERFINIKVDREERPDIDDLYMTSVQLMTGRGGWPMSVFLTPPGAGDDGAGLRPFYAGTYFPPEPRHGMPSFPQLLEALDRAWREERADVLEQADRVANAVREHLTQRGRAAELSPETVQSAAQRLLRSYDAEHGGFGGAPKFPQPANLQLLLAVYQNNPSDTVLQPLEHTLAAMAEGGMYDQVGGGFHRYSTDAQWLVPHFEKMLYDNGQLLQTYVAADRIKPTDDDSMFYKRIIRQTAEYVMREMTDDSGAFYSAQDAEVDAREGENYLWTPEQIREAIVDGELAELAIAMYGLDRGTNFQDPHDPDAPPANVLYLPTPLHKLAAERGVTLEQLAEQKRAIDAKLLAARDRRKQPGTDDKVLCAWNGMMISGMAAAGAHLNEPGYTDAAGRAADAILQHMRDGEGGLLRSMRAGAARIDGFLEDYAFLITGLTSLYRATRRQDYLDAARKLYDIAQARFAADEGYGGGYYDTLADQSDLFVRLRSAYDGAVPSGNSQMIHALLDLHELTGEAGYLERAVVDLRSLAGLLREQPVALVHAQHALLRALQVAPQQAAGPAVDVSEKTKRQPVRVELPEQVALRNGAASFAVVLDIHAEYHVNANPASAADLIATQLRVEPTDAWALDVDYPPGAEQRYEFADEAIAVYTGRVELGVTLRRLTEAAPAPRLVLRYQPCTAMSCLEAREAALPLRVAAG